MIIKDSFTIEHIQNVKTKYPTLDRQLIERTIFAFGLLEALVKVNLPFVFKGGTSLILLLEKPYRLSTDIDIIVSPTCQIGPYLQQVSTIYPFLRMEEQVRVGRNNIVKKHYKFIYKSPTTQVDIPILLDILFEEVVYGEIITKEITNEFLLTSGTNYQVKLPSIESLLGDKLTAFAPHTTGIEYKYINHQGNEIEKTLEVIKQFLDVSKLMEATSNLEAVRHTYDRVVINEIHYRGLTLTPEDCLKDTFKAALSIASRGNLYSEDYHYLIKGITKIQNHIYNLELNGEKAYRNAAIVLLYVAQLLNRSYQVIISEQPLFRNPNYRTINQIRKLDKDIFNMVAVAIRMVNLE